MTNKYYIIVDENNKPMSWGGEQLCYCDNETWQDTPHLLKMYTEGFARGLIQKSIQFSKKNNGEVGTYRLMEIKLPVKFIPYNK